MEQVHQLAIFSATGRVDAEVDAVWTNALNALFWQSMLFLLEIGFIDAIASSEGVFRLVVAVTGKVSNRFGWAQSLARYRTGLQQRGCIFAPFVPLIPA